MGVTVFVGVNLCVIVVFDVNLGVDEGLDANVKVVIVDVSVDVNLDMLVKSWI